MSSAAGGRAPGRSERRKITLPSPKWGAAGRRRLGSPAGGPRSEKKQGLAVSRLGGKALVYALLNQRGARRRCDRLIWCSWAFDIGRKCKNRAMRVRKRKRKVYFLTNMKMGFGKAISHSGGSQNEHWGTCVYAGFPFSRNGNPRMLTSC